MLGAPRDLARGVGGGLGGGVALEGFRSHRLGCDDFLLQRGKAVALRQPLGGGRRRVGRRGVAVPTPEIAAWRDKALSWYELILKRRALIGEHDAGHGEAARKRRRGFDEAV